MSDPKMDNYDSPPPGDGTTEQALMGATMLADQALKRKLVGMLPPACFWVPQNAITWAAIRTLVDRVGGFDATTVAAELRRVGKFEEIGGYPALAEILNSEFSAVRAVEYAEAVLRLAQQRRLWKLNRDAAIGAWEGTEDPVALAYRTRDELDQLLRRASTKGDRAGGGREVARLILDQVEGRQKNVPTPWPLITKFARPLMNGTITLFVGSAGGGKSFALIESIVELILSNVKCAIAMLERDRAWHLNRALALLTNDLTILNDESIRNQPDLYQSRADAFEGELDDIGRSIWDASHMPSGLDDVALWIDQRAEEGCRVIAVDPLTLVDQEEKLHLAHDRFLRAVRRTIERTGCSVILSTHPRPGFKKGAPTLDDLAGSRVLVWRSDSILWLRSNPTLRGSFRAEPSTDAAIRGDDDFNRTIRCLKARDGVAVGLDFAMHFDRRTGHLVERGILTSIVDDDARRRSELEANL